MYSGIKDIYNNIKPEVSERIRQFKHLWNNGSDKEIFMELAFCLLTPQSKAKNAWKAITILDNSGDLYAAPPEKISSTLNIVRFKNNKAKYLALARDSFYKREKTYLKNILDNISNINDKRKWLVENIKGMGYKEASHFLRNTGFVEQTAILDRHILKNLKSLHIIKEIPGTITEKKYLEIESKMKQFSENIYIPLEYLDFILWYKETGVVFK